MATSAFKSTSRRGAAAAETKAPPPVSASRRRSHSVSAVSRKTHVPLDDKTLISTEFSNSRDNPLFWATSSPPEREESEKSEKEQDMVTSGIAQSRHEIKKIGNGVHRTNSVRNRVDKRGHAMNAGIMTIQNQATEWSEDDSACSMQISNLEDGISIGSLSESEEKTIRAAYDELNAFRRNNVNTFTATNVAATPSDLVNPEAVELISEVRREYAIKLEESEERTRKLRADLAIEEHRGKELDKILKEILPDSKASGIQRSRRGRRTSNERKRMSKCLTEEAMAYFDECVSLSTFDSSDFSASEDPPYSSAGATLPVVASSLVKESPSTSRCYDQSSRDLHQKQIFDGQVQLYSCEDSGMTANSSSAEPETTQLYQFSFADKKSDNIGPQADIRSYIKNFERGTKKDVDLDAVPSYYDAGEYKVQGHTESVLIDRVLYNSRIESGGLLLCGGAISFLPFAPVL
ncbi:hypothetical protein DH2020_025812 [Rehmannia glutinosa]|uniref:Uncharacterized protein n=1 Tax=Rehmannia glutinosa TaxID=99300 RepID=A0ABR0VYQ2_REHGL